MEEIKLKLINEIIDLIISSKKGYVHYLYNHFYYDNTYFNQTFDIFSYRTGKNIIYLYGKISLNNKQFYIRKSRNQIIDYFKKISLLDLLYLKILISNSVIFL